MASSSRSDQNSQASRDSLKEATQYIPFHIQEQSRVKLAFDTAITHILDLGISGYEPPLVPPTTSQAPWPQEALKNRLEMTSFRVWTVVRDIAGLIHRHPIIRPAILEFVGISDAEYRKSDGHLLFYKFVYSLYSEARILMDAFEKAETWRREKKMRWWLKLSGSNLLKDPRSEKKELEVMKEFEKDHSSITRVDFMAPIRQAEVMGRREGWNKWGWWGEDWEARRWLKGFPGSSNAVKELKADLKKLKPEKTIIYPEALEC